MDDPIQQILSKNGIASSQTQNQPSDPIQNILKTNGISLYNSFNKGVDIPTMSSGNQWDDFQNKAIKTVQSRGFPSSVVPVLLGQAALESARGKSAPGGNYFGIKGKGTAGSNNLDTQEYGANGYYGEKSNFRAYNKPEESINDYLDLISRYPGVPEAIATNDPQQIIQAIKNAGYATSPTYVENVMNTPEYKKYRSDRLW